MFGKLIEIILGAKSGALSGVLIVAGAVVTVSGGNGVTTVTIEHPSPSPVVEASAEPKPSPLENAEPAKERQEKKHDEKERTTAPAPESCADEAKARAEALQKVHDGFTKFHTQIEHLRSQRRTDRGLETLKKADELIKEIAEKAERVLHDMGRCRDQDRDEDEDTDDEDEPEVTTASFDDADASSMHQVAARAVAAMETVYNLAKSAAEATPTPKPTEKPRATAKPRATEKPKPARTPGCDDKIYAAKKVLAAAFERFHSQNDLLWKLAEKVENEKAFATVKASDKTMHTTYDSTKQAILKAGCAENVGMQLAMKAADTFERAYLASRAAFEPTAASRP